MPPRTMVDVVVPRSWQHSATRRLTANAVLVVVGSLLVALSAQVRLDLPFTPVPITGQTFGVLVVGAALGSRRGALSLGLYLLQGALGAPVFAGGACCLSVLAGPTAGYLFGFPLAAWVVGWLSERGWDRRFGTTALAMLAGNLAIYAVGLPWLALYAGGENVFVLGFVPFIPGDVAKLAVAAGLLPSVWTGIRVLEGRNPLR